MHYQDLERSEQNPLLFVSEWVLHLIHSAQPVRDASCRDWIEVKVRRYQTVSCMWLTPGPDDRRFAL
jgi:hypothetical protein